MVTMQILLGGLFLFFMGFFVLFFGFFCFVLFFRAALAAHRSFQARGRIGATAAGLPHSHSNSGSEPPL